MSSGPSLAVPAIANAPVALDLRAKPTGAACNLDGAYATLILAAAVCIDGIGHD